MFAWLVPRFLKKKKFDKQNLFSKLDSSFSFLFPGPNPFPKVFQIPSVIQYEQEKWDFRAGPDFRSGDEKAFRGMDRKTRIDCRTLARIACSGENKKKLKLSFYFNFVAKYEVFNSRRRKCDLRKNLHNYLQQ
jgi:hypothetical protein